MSILAQCEHGHVIACCQCNKPHDILELPSLVCQGCTKEYAISEGSEVAGRSKIIEIQRERINASRDDNVHESVVGSNN